MRAHALALILSAGLAHAEVSLTIPAPLKAPPSPLDTQRAADLALDREGWLAALSAVHGAKVTAWSQGADADCPRETRGRLVREGFELFTLSQVMELGRKRGRAMSAELADLLGGSITRKVAIDLGPGIWVAVMPRPGVPPKDYRANWLKTLRGLSAGGLARVTCFLHREFRLPVGGVCAEVDISAGTLSDFASLMNLAARATVCNGIRPGPLAREPKQEPRPILKR